MSTNINDDVSANLTSNPQTLSNSSNDVNSTVTSGPLFDAVHEELMEIYIYPFVFIIFYMVVGFLGNSVVIYIFLAKWKLTKTTVFILTLAGVDLMSCVINMPSEAAILWHPIDFNYDVLCKISRYTTFIASVASSFVLIAISIDRYLMVCRPFLGRELGVKYARKTCIVAVTLGLVTTCPSLIFYGTFNDYIHKLDPDTGKNVTIVTKTCLISNFYVDNYRLPAGFYFFLFGGHVIMFVILTMLYMLIGRKLFMSTSTDVPDEKRHSLKYFGLSMMSAITGTVPNTPVDQRERASLGSRGSRAMSLENINRVDQSPTTADASRLNAHYLRLNSVPNSRRFSDLQNNSENGSDGKLNRENNENETTETVLNDCVTNGTTHKESIETIGDRSETEIKITNDKTKPVSYHRNVLSVDQLSTDDSASETSQTTPLKNKSSKNNNLSLKIMKERWNSSNGRLSSGSTTSPCPLTPLSPITPDSVRGILYRSQSVESRFKVNRIISDELRHVEVKEVSLRSNTLIMRMVTIAFVVSFLPYLVIVTLRYSNPDIPTKLSKTEQIFYHVFLRTYFINSMINPFIYGFMNIEFRIKLKELFCQYCSRKKFNLPS